MPLPAAWIQDSQRTDRASRTSGQRGDRMQITGIRAWRVELPLHEGRYSWSNGNSVDVFDSTVVAVETDAGLDRLGRGLPAGAGLPAGLCQRRPRRDRRARRRRCSARTRAQLGPAEPAHGRALKGHPYVKSALDMACWDILGKAAGLPVCTLLGGRYGDDFALYRAISQEAPDAMAAKVGRLPGRGLPQVPAQGRRRGRGRHRPHPRLRGGARARRRAGGRRQHRLDHARGGAGVRRGARRRRRTSSSPAHPTRRA